MDTEGIEDQPLISAVLRFNNLPGLQRDTLTVSQADTLQVPEIDTIQVSEIDTLQVSQPDTLQGIQPDTLIDVRADTLSGIHADTLQVSGNDTLQIAQPGTTVTQHADSVVSDQVAVSPDTVAEAPVSLPGPAEAVDAPVETEPPTAMFDIARYIENMQVDQPGQRGLFGNHMQVREEGLKKPVFAGGVESDALQGAGQSYILYLEEGAKDQGNNLHLHGTAWIPAIVILSFLLLTWIKLIYVQFITPVLVSAFSLKEADRFYNAKSTATQNAFLVLQAIFAINGGIFLLFVADHFGFVLPAAHPTLLFLAAALLILLVFATRSAAIRVVAFLFDKSALFDRYLHSVSLYNRIYGILLLPVILGLLYAGETVYEPLLYAGVIMAGVFYMLQLVRGLEIAAKKKFSVFYMFLYFCALEFIPVIVLFKLINVLLI